MASSPCAESVAAASAAALAWAEARLLSTVRRIWPQMSSVQFPDTPADTVVRVPDPPDSAGTVVRAWPAPAAPRSAPTLADSVGQKPARACATKARA